MEIPKNIDTYAFAPGTKEVAGIVCRKHNELKSVSLPDGLESIGDAAFSFCTKLKRIAIPASVEHIGVAAFCGSGIEVATFYGVPKDIDNSVFCGCGSLRKILVPAGMKQKMTEALKVDSSIVVEITGDAKQVQTDLFGNAIHQPQKQAALDFGKSQQQAQPNPSTQSSKIELPEAKRVKRIHLSYNYHEFSLKAGDIISIDDLFSGPTNLIGNPSYQFRRRVLFVFVKGTVARDLSDTDSVYDLPANVKSFVYKYKEKYSNRTPRVLVFVCNNDKDLKFYDEVKFLRANQNTITFKSILR